MTDLMVLASLLVAAVLAGVGAGLGWPVAPVVVGVGVLAMAALGSAIGKEVRALPAGERPWSRRK